MKENGVGTTLQVLNHDRAETQRANTVGTRPPVGLGPYISATGANQDPSDSEDNEGEADALDSGASEEGIKPVNTPRLGEYTFDQATLTLFPPAGAAVAPIPLVDENQDFTYFFG
jgi:hypothetical protein